MGRRTNPFVDQSLSATLDSLGEKVRQLSSHAKTLIRVQHVQSCQGSGIGSKLRRYGTGPYHLELRFDGRKLQRSLGTKIKKEAKRFQGVVEQTAAYLNRGILTLPPKYTTDDLWRFLLSGGKVSPDKKPVFVKEIAIEKAVANYLASYAKGAKEEATLGTERTHLSHFVRIIGKKKQVGSVRAETSFSMKVQNIKRVQNPKATDISPKIDWQRP